jgi:type IV pilus assembly protein PilE
MMNKSQRGVTLIELLIVVAIMGILGAVAYPSYVTFVTKSNRAEPQKELLELANLMEQYFSDHRIYTDELTNLGESADSYVTESGNYTISAAINGTGTTYTLTATVKTGSSQAGDSECASMTLNNVGQKGATNTTCWEK